MIDAPTVADAIVGYLREHPGATAPEIAGDTLNVGTVRSTLRRLESKGVVRNARYGQYVLEESGDGARSPEDAPIIKTSLVTEEARKGVPTPKSGETRTIQRETERSSGRASGLVGVEPTEGGEHGDVTIPSQEEQASFTPQPPAGVTYMVVPEGHGAGPSRHPYPATLGTVTVTEEVARRTFEGRLPNPERTYLTFVKGDSMEPWMSDGDPVWVEVEEGVGQNGRFAIEVDGEEEYQIKRLVWRGKGRLDVVSDNRAYPVVRLKHESDDVYRDLDEGGTIRVRVVGRVIRPADRAPAILREMMHNMMEVARALKND